MILTGNRIIVKLDEFPTHTVTASGLEVPHFDHYETDGGKLGTKRSNLKHLSAGTVILMSHQAKELMEKEGNPLNIGDKVFVHPNTVSPVYQFFLTRDNTVLDFDGHICVTHSQIEAIL